MSIIDQAEQPEAFPGELLRQFDEHLENVHGARPGTRQLYTRHAREFLVSAGPEGVLSLTPRDLFVYIVDHASRGQAGRTKSATSALRSLLRFMAIHGKCALSLIKAVPTAPRWKLSQIPRVLPDGDVAALLGTLDVPTAIGLRDRAMVLCLAHLGLRSAEVAELRLSDVNWRSGTLTVTGKGRHTSVLPLIPEVGRAIAEYLRAGRPQTLERHVFLKDDGSIMTGGTVRAALIRAWKRSGIEPRSRGTHALRHTLASQMLSGGTDLKQIADVLRHRSLDTTVVYTKVDVGQLSLVAQPWPGVKS